MLGDIIDGDVTLSDAGQVALECWYDLPNHYEHVELDEYVVMPNHVHGIVVITDSGGDIESNETLTGLKPSPTRRHSLSEVIRGFKTFSGRRINQLRNRAGEPVWQRNFFEHVIREEKALEMVREYIANNPAKWSEDPDNPHNLP